MTGSVNQVQSDLQAIQSDWQNLKAAVAAENSGTISAQYTASDVNTAVASAQNQLTASSKALSDAQSKASAYDNKATQLNTNARDLY